MTISDTLLALRREIDAVDDRLFALLRERSAIVARVAEYKAAHEGGQHNIRPGREALMLRRVYAAFTREKFSPLAAMAMWRLIISASTAIETPLVLSIFAPDNDNALYGITREYFGGFLPMHRHPTAGRVIGDVMDKTAHVAILPQPNAHDQNPWWLHLLDGEGHQLHVFAVLPFVQGSGPSALAVGYVTPEETGDDTTLMCLEADVNTSTHRLQNAFATAGLHAEWVQVHATTPDTRHHLVRVQGFLTETDPVLMQVQPELRRLCVIGAYANPIIP